MVYIILPSLPLAKRYAAAVNSFVLPNRPSLFPLTVVQYMIVHIAIVVLKAAFGRYVIHGPGELHVLYSSVYGKYLCEIYVF